MGRQAGEAAVQLLAAAPVPAGTMPVVIGPGWGGVLVHECFGHSLEGDGIRKKTSIRASQFGQQVAAKGVDIYDDATVPYSRGSFRIDDEGTPGQKTWVVEDGVLKGYCGPVERAHYRQPFDRQRPPQLVPRLPDPALTNTYIAAGTVVRRISSHRWTRDSTAPTWAAAASIRRMANFSFHVTEGFLIEGGKLTSPVSNATLTGNGAMP